MIGDRIRQARLAAALTLKETAERVSAAGGPSTRQALSNYERNERVPDAGTLLLLARALDVRPSYFLTKPSFSVDWKAFRCHRAMGKNAKQSIKAFAKSVVERHMYLRDLLNTDEPCSLPTRRRVTVDEQAEEVAAELRKCWRLGEAPIESLTQTIERNGGIAVSVPLEVRGFDGLSGYVNDACPVVAASRWRPDDRVRFDLAHELGHLLLDCEDLSEKEEEKCAHRFAGALLVPSSAMQRELGQRRRSLELRELALLKLKYGLSMQALLYRAEQSGVISETQRKRYHKEFGYRRWRKKEPVDFEGDERPTRLKQMTLRALAEDLITPDKAEELCPGCALEEEEKGAEMALSAADVLQLPPAQRDEILRRAALMLQDAYAGDHELTAFEPLAADGIDE